MELPALPAERGHSKGVRQRVERSLSAVRAAIGFLDVLTEALERKFGERSSRMAGRGDAAGEGGRERYVSVPDFVHHIGRDIESKRDAMVQADLALAERRRIRRQACDRRDRLKRQLYDARVWFKKRARRALGKRWKSVLTLRGETSRDPFDLARQADLDVQWATGSNAPRHGIGGMPVDWAARVAPLAPLRDDLWAAIDVVAHQEALVIQKLSDRIEAVKAFDEWYGKGARMLECTYVLLGLPTLASAVRPHLKVAGRVGRPSITPPVDDYPDLVERARATGLLPAEPERRESSAETDERHRLAAWLAAYRQVIWPYLSFLASLPARRSRPEGSASGAMTSDKRSVTAWPARVLARWRQRGESSR